jgi:hypothetical protein
MTGDEGPGSARQRPAGIETGRDADKDVAGDFPADPSSNAVEEIRVDPEKTSRAAQEALIKAEKRKSEQGLIAGMICVVIGAVLVIFGATGNVSLDLVGDGVSAKLQTGVVGIVLWVLAALIITVTRFDADFTSEGGKRK